MWRKNNIFYIFNGLNNTNCKINIEKFKAIQENINMVELFKILHFPIPIKIIFSVQDELTCIVDPESTITEIQQQYPGLAFYSGDNYTGSFPTKRPIIELATSNATAYLIYAKNEVKFQYGQKIFPIVIYKLKNVGQLNIELADKFGVDHVAIKTKGNLHLDPEEKLTFIDPYSNDAIQVEPRSVFVRYGKDDDPIKIDVSACNDVADFKEKIKEKVQELKNKKIQIAI